MNEFPHRGRGGRSAGLQSPSASQDVGAASRICEAPRAGGIEV